MKASVSHPLQGYKLNILQILKVFAQISGSISAVLGRFRPFCILQDLSINKRDSKAQTT